MRPYTNGGYDSDRPQPGSNPGSPSKRVAFRDSPPQVRSIDHQVTIVTTATVNKS